MVYNPVSLVEKVPVHITTVYGRHKDLWARLSYGALISPIREQHTSHWPIIVDRASAIITQEWTLILLLMLVNNHRPKRSVLLD